MAGIELSVVDLQRVKMRNRTRVRFPPAAPLLVVLKGFGKIYLGGFDGSPYTAPDLCGIPSGNVGLGADAPAQLAPSDLPPPIRVSRSAMDRTSAYAGGFSPTVPD